MQYKWIALSVTILDTLMAGIDTRIIIVGLPTVARELGADVESIIWVSQAYLLASTVGLLLIGRITDVVGRVKEITANAKNRFKFFMRILGYRPFAVPLPWL
jgi:MFS family permease